MELSHLARRLGVTQRPPVEKAKEYQRLLALKMPGKGTMSAEARSVCCVELGCNYHHIPIDSALTLKYSLCKTASAYSKALQSVQQALSLSVQVGVRELAIQYGCVQAAELARRVLHTYKTHMSSETAAAAAAASGAVSGAEGSIVVTHSIPAALLATRSVYPCVAFFLSCRLLKLVGVDKRSLLSTAQVSEREFNAVCESFRDVMPELRPPEPTPSPSRKRKAKAAALEEEEHEGSELAQGDISASDESQLRALLEGNGDAPQQQVSSAVPTKSPAGKKKRTSAPNSASKANSGIPAGVLCFPLRQTKLLFNDGIAAPRATNTATVTASSAALAAPSAAHKPIDSQPRDDSADAGNAAL